MKEAALSKAIKEFRQNIEHEDYANLGAKGKYLTVPYRLKFIREHFGERLSIQTESNECSDGMFKFKASIYLDNILISVGESKQNVKKDKEFEKQQTVAIGRGLSFAGFFGDEIATAEEMEQFLKQKPTTNKTIEIKNIKKIADDWIEQMTSVSKHSKSQLYFEKNLTPIRKEFESDLREIALDPFQQIRVDKAYNNLKSQIQNKGTNGR